ncbi:MAG: hypothetical protein C4518_07115 [Desulfobacteraceae bacterium]|nr:MAG: hypothetical protein C4518_07115 [Desulfobacteraceae bacterium]
MGFQRALVLCLAFVIVLFPGTGMGLEYRFGWEFFDGFFKENNYLNPATDTEPDTLDYDNTYAIIGAYPNVDVQFDKNFSAYFQAGVDWTHSWDEEDTDDWDAEVVGAAISYATPKFGADLGIQSFRPGKGLISYNDEPGISLQYKGWDRAFIKGDGFQVFDNSPMGMLSLGYHPGFLETVELFGAGFHEADDNMSDLFIPFYDGAVSATSGNIFYIGGMADFFLWDAYVSGIVIRESGSVEIDHATGGQKMDLAAYLMDVEISYPVVDRLSASAFIFFATGDSDPTDGDLTAFMSPMPFNDRTMIFFNGGFARYDVEESVVLNGVTWDGVVAPGIGLDYQVSPEIVTKMTVALLFPEKDPYNSQSWYGWETDAKVTYEFYPSQWLFFEAGILIHGNYWKNQLGYQPDPSTRLAAGLNLFF